MVSWSDKANSFTVFSWFLSIDVFTLTDCKEQNYFLHISFQFNITLSFNSLLIVKMSFLKDSLHCTQFQGSFYNPLPPFVLLGQGSRSKVQLLWTSGDSLSFVHSTFENHLLMRDQFSHSNPSVNWCKYSIRSRWPLKNFKVSRSKLLWMLIKRQSIVHSKT